MQIRATLILAALAVSSSAIPLSKRTEVSSSSVSTPGSTVSENSISAPGFSETEVTDFMKQMGSVLAEDGETVVETEGPDGPETIIEQSDNVPSTVTVTATRTVTTTATRTVTATSSPVVSVSASKSVTTTSEGEVNNAAEAPVSGSEAVASESAGQSETTTESNLNFSGPRVFGKRLHQLKRDSIFTNEAVIASCPGCAPSLPRPAVSGTIIVTSASSTTSGSVDVATESAPVGPNSDISSVTVDGSSSSDSVSVNISPFFKIAGALFSSMQNSNKAPSVAIISNAVNVDESVSTTVRARSIPPRFRRYPTRLVDLD